jgi:hypothetical protein
MNIEAIAERVAAGAALLDEKIPGWRDEINIKTLDLVSFRQCILGQLFGHYRDGLEALDVSPEGAFGRATDVLGRPYGFYPSDKDSYAEEAEELKLLTVAWTHKIQGGAIDDPVRI